MIRPRVPAIDPVFTGSPQYVHDALSARLGVPVVVKVETVNPIRAFKGRGTWVAVQGLAGEGRIGPRQPVVVASAGNFGQGIAYAARALGIPSVVFTSRNANRAKIDRMRAIGATVLEEGEDFDDARGASEQFAIETGAELLVDGDDPRIAQGAASLALEVTDAIAIGTLPPIAVASVPVGNGALIDGVGAWFRHVSPTTRIVGIQAKGADAMTRSFAAGRPIDSERADTYADAVRLVNENPYGNGVALFTRDGGAARQFQFDVQAGMVGVNVPIPVPVAYYSFGGWKASLFGDTHMYGPDGVHFYTRTKVVTSRWPDPTTSTVDLGFPRTR